MDLLETRFQVIPPGAAKALKRERLKAAGIVAFVAAAAAILFVIDPASSNLYPSCPFNALTGLYCPGCGIQIENEYLPPGHPITHEIELDIDALKARQANKRTG